MRLSRSVENAHCKADFGVLGAKYVPRVLAEYGRIDLAYRLLTQTDFPGWGHWLKRGATSLWENWDGSGSRNHIMFGDVSAWMYHFLAGIRPDPEQPGFRHMLISRKFLQLLSGWRRNMLPRMEQSGSAGKRQKMRFSSMLRFRWEAPQPYKP